MRNSRQQFNWGRDTLMRTYPEFNHTLIRNDTNFNDITVDQAPGYQYVVRDDDIKKQVERRLKTEKRGCR